MGTIKTYLMPDLKSVVWLGIGVIVAYKVLPKLKG
jgi:hypothetical protein